jgi:hypothetical protein
VSASDYPNLKPWQKGQSGNPSGRPKQLITDRLRARGEADWAKLEKKLWSMALAGELAAIREIYDRVEGRVPQPTTVEGGLEITVQRADRNK